jgi:hypothetical protein
MKDLKDHITRGMTHQQYCELPGVNSHAISFAAGKTMRHMQAYLKGEIPDKDSHDKRFGRALHAAILEPEAYRKIPTAGPCSEIIKDGKNKGKHCGCQATYFIADQWRCGKHCKDVEPIKDYVTDEETARIERIISEIKQAGQLAQFRRPGWSEVVIEFELMGIKCKARLDRLPADGSAIIDIKKVQVGKAGKDDFEKSCESYGYHIQAAFYCLAVHAITGQFPIFTWLIVEDGPPYAVNLLDASDFVLRAGRHEIEETLRRWKRATETGKFTGYIGPRTPEGGLPPYAVNRYRNLELGPPMLGERESI